VKAEPTSPESIHQKDRAAVVTKIEAKKTTPHTGARTTRPTRAGVQSIPAVSTAATNTATPNSARDALRNGRSISSSWGSAPSGRTSTASSSPVRTYWRSRSMLPTARSAVAKAAADSPTITIASARGKPPSVRVRRNSTRTVATSKTVAPTLPTRSTRKEVR